ncbi:AAA family ATPase [Nocardioides marmoriginsengisoli]|uniref:AAA family ATPase n=1 Tax=Nocardioides marmoriginsengisoli TaxID=661483 RepID=A0A3N0CNQ5_9ACTN|nr:AAA family ATPase [Nocardioides marmoriginsengisoli]RNL64949.1 AAA family ATPase [Nocardioides marmoriginsengisoli]
MLWGPDDHLPSRPQRVLVNGSSGGGKTTLAAALAVDLDLPHTEIDALFHGPDWTPRPEFLDDVRALAAQDTWITEWQYADAQPILLARCDLMVWLNTPRPVAMWRVTRRTLRRRFRREVLWNGNREGPLRKIFTDPEHIIRWAWSSHPRAAERVDQVLSDRPELPVVRLRNPAEVERWRSGLTCSGTPEPPR